jgi:signal transduction histidine kinase/CheY-like chemotaxis protein/AraC-like DNA-binding protein
MFKFKTNDRLHQCAIYFVIALLLLEFTNICQAQANFFGPIDSLRRAYQTAAPDQKARCYFELGLTLQNESTDSLLVYANALNTLQQQDPAPALRGYFHELMGTYYGHTRQMEQSIVHFQQSEQAYALARMPVRQLQILNNLTFIFNTLNRFGESIVAQRKSISIAMTIGDTLSVIEMLHQHCLVQTRQKLFDDARLSNARAAALEQQLGISAYFSYAGLGKIFEETPGKSDSALLFYDKALRLAQQGGNPIQVAMEQSNLARCYTKIKRFEEARKIIQAAIDTLETMPTHKIQLSKCYLIRAAAELGSGNPDAALSSADRSAELMKNRKDYTGWANLHDIRARAFAQKGNYQQAYTESVAWKTATDSMLIRERAGMIADITAQYRSQEQQATIAEQNLQLERTRARNRLYLAGAIIALLAGGGIAFGLRQQRRQTQLELRLQQAEAAQLRDLDRSKSAFFANISHEFRTPLTLILSPLRDLLQGRFKGDLQRTYTTMQRNGERLLALVNQLLDLSRLEAGKLSLNPQAQHLSAHLRGLCAAFESLANSRQINFSTELPQTELWYRYDRDKLEKIVVNLLSNAFKFTKEEGTIHCALRLTPQQQVQIQVSDSGIGIPPAEISRIFDRFYTIENQEADFQVGSGIGLALTKELVTLMQGDIKVSSVENEGSVFTVTLPLKAVVPELQPAAAVAVATPLAPESAAPSFNAPTKNGKADTTVLVVEDNPDLALYLSEQLQDRYQVHLAENGRIALEWALEHTPDLIITDLMMPEMDGLQLTQALKNDLRSSHIPIMMLTAKVERDDRLTGLKTGAEAYLSKPLDSEELRAVAERLLQQRSILYQKYSQSIRLGVSDLPDAPSVEQQWLKTVLKAIEDNMEDEMFGVEQLADQLAMSRSNLFRKLNAITGKNPNELLREMRLERAKQLLEQGASNVSEVAYMVGFNSRTYFARCFAAQYGVAPSEV